MLETMDLLLNSTVTVSPDVHIFKDGHCRLKQCTLMEVLRDLPHAYKEHLIKLKSLPYHSEEQKALKLETPQYFICGKLNGSTSLERLTDPNNLMIVDIDKKDNEHLDFKEVRDTIFRLPYVMGVYESCSGQGLYCIIPIPDIYKTKSYYNKLLKVWKYHYNINIDPVACNINRARFISYDPKWMLYTREYVQEWIQEDFGKTEEEDKQERILNLIKTKPKQPMTKDKLIELTHKAMWLMVNGGYSCDRFVNSYGAWYHLGCEMKNFEDGYDLFYKLSNNGRWNDDESVIRKKYDSCKATGITPLLHMKWQGMAKKKFGERWWEKYEEPIKVLR